MEKPIAIFDRKEDEIVYLKELLVCQPYAIITTRLEFLTTEGGVVALDKLVDKELFSVGQKEMIEIMKEIDRRYSATHDLAFAKESKVEHLAYQKARVYIDAEAAGQRKRAEKLAAYIPKEVKFDPAVFEFCQELCRGVPDNKDDSVDALAGAMVYASKDDRVVEAFRKVREAIDEKNCNGVVSSEEAEKNIKLAMSPLKEEKK